MTTRRTHAPGAAIHITARTQNKAKWFVEELGDNIASIIVEGVQSFGHTLLAYAVMPNHFHIILRQSHSPLAHTMQRIMQRTSFIVRKRHDIDGHAFSRSYWSDVCGDPAYLRTAIIYTHLNPCKAGLCRSPNEYRWTSHRAYAKAGDHALFDPTQGLLVFAIRSLDINEARKAYRAEVRRTMARREHAIPGDFLIPGSMRLVLTSCPEGDSYWATSFSQPPFEIHKPLRRANVRARAEELLRKVSPACDLDMLRNAGRSRSIAPIRSNIIASLISSGHRHCDIARCLRVSPALVSRIGACIALPATRKQ